VKLAAGASVADHGGEARRRILEVVQHADAIDEIERAEVCRGQIALPQIEHPRGQVGQVSPRLLESLAQLDAHQPRGAVGPHVREE
jgi:hypothetical protein